MQNLRSKKGKFSPQAIHSVIFILFFLVLKNFKRYKAKVKSPLLQLKNAILNCYV